MFKEFGDTSEDRKWAGVRGGRKMGGKKEATESAFGNSSYALSFHRTSLYGHDRWNEGLRR